MALQSHAVPQQISSYEFRLVGDMTLKQFGQLAGGVIIALVFYSLPIHPIIKWPMVFFWALVGILLAFVPFQERPLTVWVVAFFKAIYAPTQFLWKKRGLVPEYFAAAARPVSKVEKKKVGAEEIAAGEERAQAYLASLPQVVELSELEKAEREFLAQINRLMTQPLVRTGATTDVEKGGVKPQSRVVKKPLPKVEKKARPVKMKAKFPEAVKMTAAGKAPDPVFGEQDKITTKAASFSLEAPIPNPPTQANMVVGQVVDKYGRIVENAIMEIKDEKGTPVRALRTNKLGHFRIVTALRNGKYTIEIEKDEFLFEPVTFETKGEVILPITIIGEGEKERVEERVGKPVMIYEMPQSAVS